MAPFDAATGAAVLRGSELSRDDDGDDDEGDRPGGITGYGGYGDESSDDDDDDEARGASSGVGEGDSAPIGSKRGGKREGAGRKHGSVSQPKPKPQGGRTEQQPQQKRKATSAPDEEVGEDTAPLAMDMERGGAELDTAIGESSLGSVLDGIAERLSNLFTGNPCKQP